MEKAENLTAVSGSIYARPDLYDLAFSYRVFEEEFGFLRKAHAKHAPGQVLNSVLELGCGPARHAIGLAKTGVPKVTALDLSKAMLQHAEAKAKRARLSASVTMSFVQGDMSDMGDSCGGQRFDMVICLLGTFSHMTTNAAAGKCFGEVARHLSPGGVFILELSHPGDLFDGTFILGDGGKEVWEVPHGERKVLVEWGAEFDNFDPVTQVIDRTVSINVFKGEVLEDSLEEVVQYRQFTVQEIDMLATAHGMKIDGLYGEMRLDVDLSHEEAYRMVMVLKRA
ncbi:MAG: hypothetical protein WDW36_009289 [Sanguina aurantia]